TESQPRLHRATFRAAPRFICDRMPSTPSPTPLGQTPETAQAPAAGAVVPSTIDVLGVSLAEIDYEGALDWIDARIASGERGYVCVANTHTVAASREDDELRAALQSSSLTVPDGQPLVWAMNALGAGLADRVYGPELMERACARA